MLSRQISAGEASGRLSAGPAILLALGLILLAQGCTTVYTYPTTVRAGETISVMVGGTEKVRKESLQVTLSDSLGGSWDLQALGKVRSVFMLRADGRAKGMHYSPYLDTFISWSAGHEPLQAVLVADVPAGVPTGPATLTVSRNVDDDSSGIADPLAIGLEIIEASDLSPGTADDFLRQTSGQPLAADLARLEPAPYAKVHFGTGSTVIYAASLVIDFDETVVNPGDLNVYVPESTVRGSFLDPGTFGATQRMAYWRQDGQQLNLYFFAPQGIKTMYLMAYIMHPENIAGPINFDLVSTTVYDQDGNEIPVPAYLDYYP